MKGMTASAISQQNGKFSNATEGHGIRKFCPTDLPRIAEICRNVYGGTDVLPRTIQQKLMDNPAATVLVSQPANSQSVEAVVCAEVRGKSSFLFGLRVAESARGGGLASQLMAAISLHSCSQPEVLHIQSTTIPQNTPAVRIFQKLGFTHTHTVDRWPQEAAQQAYEQAIGFVPNTQQPHKPVQHTSAQLHMLDHIPGVRALMEKTADCVQQPGWVCCSDMQQLQQAVASIREQQHQQQDQPQESCGEAAAAAADSLLWLPWVYEIYPLDSSWVQHRVHAGEVFLLPSGTKDAETEQGSTLFNAVVVLSHSDLNQRTCAGILATQHETVAAALQFVGSKVPHFVAYIDCGSRHNSGALDAQLLLPPVIELGRQGPVQQEYMCYLVYSRAAVQQGLPDVSGASKV